MNARPSNLAPLWLTAAALTALTAPAFAQEVDLRWKFQPGQKLSLTLQQTTDTETAVLGSKQRTQLRLELAAVLRWEVLTADAEAAQIRQSIQSLSVRMNTQKDDLLFDSASDDPPRTKAEQQLGQRLGPLVGAEYRLTVTDRGEVTEVQWPAKQPADAKEGEPDEAADADKKAADVSDILSPENLRQILRQTIFPLPESPVRPRQKWVQEAKLPAALGTLTLQRTFTLQDPLIRDGLTLQEIALTGRMGLEPAPSADKSLTRLRNQQLSGVLHFDATTGLLVDSRVEQVIITDSTYKDTRVAVKVRSLLTAEMSVVE